MTSYADLLAATRYKPVAMFKKIMVLYLKNGNGFNSGSDP